MRSDIRQNKMRRYRTSAIALRHRLIGCSLFITLLLLLAGCTSSESGAQNSAADSQLSLGKAVYEANCASCHGEEGEGQPNWQEPDADGKYPAPPHDSSGHTWHHADGQLLELIAKGGGAGSQMIAYEDVLSDAEIEAVLAYLKTFWGERELAYQQEVTERFNSQ